MSNADPTDTRGQPMRCPSCQARLVEVERSEVLIDACPDCRGIWLDRGELDKILARERAASAADPNEDFFREAEGRRAPPDAGDYDGQRRKSRKRSLLEDLLDFD